MNSFKLPIVLLVNGSFPSHSRPLNVLKSAGTVICTDGSANRLLKLGLIPHIIIGDLDSLDFPLESFKGLIIPVPDQEKTDLEKALDWCLKNNILKLVILGATGNRDDQGLVNLFLLAEYLELDITLITDYFTINALRGERTFSSFKDQIVSLIPVQHIDSITTSGLSFPLQNESLKQTSRGISNRSLGSSFNIKSSHKLWIFRSHAAP
ncbi:MAG: thiamine diphosphokinase [Candidatus Neomarinimicrobiota bacterium]